MNIPDKLFINLKILSKIQKNGRITRSYDGVISLENETFYQSVKRFLSHDSRRQSIFEINSIINECIETLNNIVNNKYMNQKWSSSDEYFKNCENLLLLTSQLENAKKGIENLKFTYTNDLNIESQLDIILLKIYNIIKDMKYKIHELSQPLSNFKFEELKKQNEYYAKILGDHHNTNNMNNSINESSIIIDMENIGNDIPSNERNFVI